MGVAVRHFFVLLIFSIPSVLNLLLQYESEVLAQMDIHDQSIFLSCWSMVYVFLHFITAPHT
jgi:hypothetical protein